MATGSTQSTSSSVASTNPALTSLFTTLFGGQNGAGATATGALTGIAKGQNIDQLNKDLTASNKTTLASSIGALKEAFGSQGVGSSSSLGRQISSTITQNQNNLTQSLAGADLQAQSQQLSAAQYLTQIFSGAANQYYTNRSTTENKDSAMSSFINVFNTLFKGYGSQG